MNPLANQTLAQIVTGNSRSAAVFEKYHLDYCCKGKRSLQQACRDQQIPLDTLLRELEMASQASAGSAPAVFPGEKATLAELADYIINTHHAYVKSELPQLQAYAEKIAASYGHQHPELFKIAELVNALKEEMELHMQKEENVVFPRITEMEKIAGQEGGAFRLHLSYLQSPIRMMEQEHDHAGSLLDEIRRFSNGFTPPSDACTTYKLAFSSLQAFETDLHQHIHLENNILFPRAIAMVKRIGEASLN